MICSEIISKNNVESYLKNVIVNKRYLALIMAFFDQVKDIQKHEKMMFLLYNEYISLEDLAACSNDAQIISNIEFYEDRINAIISQHTEKWKTPYAFIRDTFFRDYVVTLTLENYEDIYNIKNQLAIVYSSLTADEAAFLNTNFGITKSNFINLIRIQTSTEVIELSEIEKNGTALNNITSMLSGIKDFRSPTVKNQSGSDYTSDTIKSVLKKIDQGTIH